MKTRPVRHYGTPRYPAKLQIVSNPDLLRQHTPPAWRAVPEMAGAVALFLAANTTVCRGEDKLPSTSKAVAVVAPVFEHGVGRGVTGCVVVSPPVFLSEEEALQVIREELGQQGLQATQANFTVAGVQIPQRFPRYQPKNRRLETQNVTSPDRQKPLTASAADPKKKVAVEFVSNRNYYDLGGAQSGSTVQSYDFKGVAASLAETVSQQGADKIYFGAFYDPASKMDTEKLRSYEPKTLEGWRRAVQEGQEKGRAESKRLLRLQVQDFVKWLQAQGAI